MEEAKEGDEGEGMEYEEETKGEYSKKEENGVAEAREVDVGDVTESESSSSEDEEYFLNMEKNLKDKEN